MVVDYLDSMHVNNCSVKSNSQSPVVNAKVTLLAGHGFKSSGDKIDDGTMSMHVLIILSKARSWKLTAIGLCDKSPFPSKSHVPGRNAPSSPGLSPSNGLRSSNNPQG
ncbi:hypothetical protein Cni_G25383 [Canna indica]|uniref:Uncharacterized protein n=1 Tax=Canna indica TaxID=4628 RepID=A0AAQ3QL04_9LILI|nr:hypothetical protein Cni_G25383 [Canna indica]